MQHLLWLDLKDCLDFDARAKRQLRHPDGRASMQSELWPEHIDEKLRRPIDDQVMVGEVQVTVNVSSDAHHPLNAIQRTNLSLDEPQDIRRTQLGRLLRILQ